MMTKKGGLMTQRALSGRGQGLFDVLPLSINIARCDHHNIEYLERLHRADAVLVALVIVARERTFQHSTGVCEIVCLLDGNVAPVGHFNQASHLCHG